MNNNGYDRDGSGDDFWDISKLVPKRSPTLSKFKTRPTVTEYAAPTPSVGNNPSAERHGSGQAAEAGNTSVTREAGERTISPELMRGFRESVDETYYPDNMGLIKRVTIKRFIDKYDFYDSFRKSAILYFDYKTPRCDFAQYYSYMPQYSQLTPTQKSYYFFWRDEVRHGRYPKTDYSYVYLYVYEILNLPDKIPPEEGIRLLCRVWREYRDVLPRLDLYFSIWVEDYCLVHKLPAPTEEISGFLFDCLGKTPLKEFYLRNINDVGFAGIEPLLAYLSDYDWRRGKFAGDGTVHSATVNGEDYKRHMERAMYLLFSEMWEDITGGNTETTVIKRDAFPNSLCTHTVKCKLEIEYVSLTNAEGARRAVTAAVRYTENKLRALLGVKSRLAVRELPESYKRVIDTYFDRYFKEEERKRRESSRPAYERLYEAPKTELSFAGADEIEFASWQVTARLTEFSDTPLGESPVAESTPHFSSEKSAGIREQDLYEVSDAAVPSKSHINGDACGADITPTACTHGDAYGLSQNDVAYIGMMLGESLGYVSDGLPEEATVERINEAFLDNFGDVILEGDGGAYRIIEDYREDIKEWLYNLPR